MRLLLDQSLPQALVATSVEGLSIERWSESGLADAELVTVAAERGFDGVVFLGPSVLARDNVTKAARDAGILLVATSADDPVSAQRDITRHMHTIARHTTGGSVLVLSHEVRTVEPTQV